MLAAGLCLTLSGQTKGHLNVGEPQKVSGSRNAVLQAKVPVSVQPGYHVNNDKPNDPSLIPLKLTWTSLGALQGGEVTFPKPGLEKVEGLDKPLLVFTGNFDLLVNFKVAPNAPAGPGVAAGKLRYQACNSTTCFPPLTVDVKVPYDVE